MLKFKEFLKEETEKVLDVDEKHLEGNKNDINGELDVLTGKPYQNAPIFLNQLRGCLERYGILLPAEMTPHFLQLNAEVAYKMGDSDNYLYAVYDTNEDGFVDGYAQVVSSDELDSLMSSEMSEKVNSDRAPVQFRPSTWYAKRDDDAGNTDEY